MLIQILSLCELTKILISANYSRFRLTAILFIYLIFHLHFRCNELHLTSYIILVR